MPLDRGFIDQLGLNGPSLHVSHHRLHCIDDFCASSIAESDGQDQFPKMGRFFLGRANPVLSGRRKQLVAPDGAKADALLNETCALRGEVMFQESHQGADFLGRTIPVLLGKSVDSQGMDAELQAEGDHLSDGVDAFTMAGDARQSSKFRPAPIAVHDDGHMFGQQVRFQLGTQFAFRQVVEISGGTASHNCPERAYGSRLA